MFERDRYGWIVVGFSDETASAWLEVCRDVRRLEEVEQ